MRRTVESPERFIAETEQLGPGDPVGDLMDWESTLDLLDADGRYVGTVPSEGNFDETAAISPA